MGKTPDPPPAAAVPDPSSAAPFVFLHIPKTAGTSLLTLLGNTFAERHVRRLDGEELRQENIAALLGSPAMADIRCLAGHAPVHAFAGRLGGFRAFTLLRHPVERVMSLYRFTRRQPPATLARIGLPPDFDLPEFLDCRSPEVFGQVRNGMCRFLCDLPAASQPDHALFWRPDLPDDILGRALATLRGLHFGLAEAMADTFLMFRATLGLSLDHAGVVENATDPPGPERSSDHLLRVIELNTGDLALYHEAAALFRARMAALTLADGRDAGALVPAMPRPGLAVSIRDLPSRQGFHLFEPDLGFAWVTALEPARIAFAAAPGRGRLRLKLFAISDDYPAGEIGVTLNGVAVSHRWEKLDGTWGILETAPVPLAALNTLALTVPYTLPARFISPGSPDLRQLSVAVATLELAGGAPAA